LHADSPGTILPIVTPEPDKSAFPPPHIPPRPAALAWRGAALALGAFILFSTPLLPTAQYTTSNDTDGHSDLAEEAAFLAPPPVEAAASSAELDCRALASSAGRISTWDPPGPKLVGLQAGHWLTREAPDEFARLRAQTGTTGGGYTEWELNLDIAERTAILLMELGVEAEVLPTTLPPCYRAHVFLSIHADGDLSGLLSGFKVARASASPIAATDDAFVAALNEQYALATSLPRDDNHISRRMLNYYAFNTRRYVHTIGPGVPAAIIETGFLTNWRDRLFLTQQTDLVAAGIANGILQFVGLEERIPL